MRMKHWMSGNTKIDRIKNEFIREKVGLWIVSNCLRMFGRGRADDLHEDGWRYQSSMIRLA